MQSPNVDIIHQRLLRMRIFSWVFFSVMSLALLVNTYGQWVISRYPGFLVRWFGPSIMGLDAIRFLRMTSLLFTFSWLVGIVLITLNFRAYKKLQVELLRLQTVVEGAGLTGNAGLTANAGLTGSIELTASAHDSSLSAEAPLVESRSAVSEPVVDGANGPNSDDS